MTVTNATPGRGYDLPDPTNKLSEDVLRLITALQEVDSDLVAAFAAIAGKAAASHNHPTSDILGLSTLLAGKADLVHTHPISQITGIAITGPASGQVLAYNGTAWVNTGLTISSITGLSAALASLQSQIDTLDGGSF